MVVVRRSLSSGDRQEAQKRTTRERAAMLARREAGRTTDDRIAKAKPVEALRRAEGVVARSAEEPSAGPLDELLARVETLIARDPTSRQPVLAKA
jgi:hypothetical protein